MPLKPLLDPRAVAVVGAAREPGKVGNVILANLLDGGFAGDVYPVNPRADEVLGLKAYASLADLPGPVDLAVIALPAPAVPDIITECGTAGIGAAIVISAGFTESGPEGASLQREVATRARDGGVRLLGPNCLGLISTHHRLNAAFAGAIPPRGGIAFVTQSGALGTAIVDSAGGSGSGLSYLVSLGNRSDIAEPDLLAAFEADEETRVIALYLESIADGPSFLSAAASTVRAKPVIALKSGASDSGARAVSSHTGSLAGSDVAYEAAFTWAGIIRARTTEELFDFASAFSLQPVPRARGVAILTNAGGPAVLATDAVEAEGLSAASLDTETLDSLRDALPAAAAIYNPVDVLGDADPQRFRTALEALYADEEVGSVIVILTPQAMTDTLKTAQAVIETASASGGTTTLCCFMGGPAVSEARALLAEGSIPGYPTPERAVRALSALYSYSATRPSPPGQHKDSGHARDAVRDTIRSALDSDTTFLTAQDGADIVSSYGIRTPPGALAADREMALSIAEHVGYPVALKIVSPEILHKSDVGGIRIGIETPDELARAYDDVLGRARSYLPDAPIDGVHIQRMAPAGREVIIGVDRDPVFGPLLMFGLGGIYVEVLRDVTFRLCPVDREAAGRMISDIRSFGLLRGVRGQPPADLAAVADALVSVSALVLDHPEIEELDINPLIVADAGEGVWAADVRIGIGGT